MTYLSKREVEEEFDDEFILNASQRSQIKSHISSLRLQDLDSLIEQLEGMRKPEMKEVEIDATIDAYGLKGGMSVAMKNGYNQAIDDQISLLTDLRKKLI